MTAVAALIASFGGRIDVESGLTLTNSFAQGTITSGNFTRTSNAVFACDLTWPSSFTANGLLFEAGGTGTGAGVGLISNGVTLRVVAGDGAGSATITAILDIATSTLVAGSSGTLVWEYRINPGRARAWWNGTLLGAASTSGGGALESSQWAGTDDGVFNTTSASLTTLLTSATFQGTVNSTLRYYSAQLVTV